MKIHSIHRFKLTDSANKIYQYVSRTSSYKEFTETANLKLKYHSIKGNTQLLELRIIANQSIRVIIYDQKYGIGYFEGNEDLLLIKKSIDKLGHLYIYVLKDMKPYMGIIFQQYIEGYFNSQIRKLKAISVQ